MTIIASLLGFGQYYFGFEGGFLSKIYYDHNNNQGSFFCQLESVTSLFELSSKMSNSVVESLFFNLELIIFLKQILSCLWPELNYFVSSYLSATFFFSLNSQLFKSHNYGVKSSRSCLWVSFKHCISDLITCILCTHKVSLIYVN